MDHRRDGINGGMEREEMAGQERQGGETRSDERGNGRSRRMDKVGRQKGRMRKGKM